MNTALAPIVEKVYAGERLTFADAMALFHSPDLPLLGHLASVVRFRKHPERVVTFIISRNINYTNVCWVQCKFCAFYRSPRDPEAYVLSDEAIFQKIEELDALGGREILIQGGLNPKLRIDYFERLFRAIRERWPHINIHGLSVAEILYIAKISKLSVEETLIRLKAAGMGSLPGAGGEILVDEIREIISPYKDRTDEWLEVMRTAHRVGLPTTATMMFGHVERPEHRVESLLRIRELQDETGGFTAFIAWNFQPEGTRLKIRRKATGFDYLRTIAVARLVLDNVPNIQASWVTQGPKIAQLSLEFGVNDFGQTMIEENVVSAAGTRHELGIRDICWLIRDAGYRPRLRTTFYEDAGDPEQLLEQLARRRRPSLQAAPTNGSGR